MGAEISDEQKRTLIGLAHSFTGWGHAIVPLLAKAFSLDLAQMQARPKMGAQVAVFSRRPAELNSEGKRPREEMPANEIDADKKTKNDSEQASSFGK